MSTFHFGFNNQMISQRAYKTFCCGIGSNDAEAFNQKCYVAFESAVSKKTNEINWVNTYINFGITLTRIYFSLIGAFCTIGTDDYEDKERPSVSEFEKVAKKYCCNIFCFHFILKWQTITFMYVI